MVENGTVALVTIVANAARESDAILAQNIDALAEMVLRLNERIASLETDVTVLMMRQAINDVSNGSR